jgi:hypothetical protein
MSEHETLITLAYKAWRAVLPVHPAAEIIPEYTSEKKLLLGRLMKIAGRMNVPVIIFFDPVSGKLSLGDGRSRLDSLVAVGVRIGIQITGDTKVSIVAEGIEIPEPQVITVTDGFDPYAFVAATNVGRRHLNTAEKRQIGAKLIIARPELADRAIAKLANIDHKTVAAIRKEILANGETPHSTERIEKTGRRARGRKPSQTSPKVQVQVVEPTDASRTTVVDVNPPITTIVKPPTATKSSVASGTSKTTEILSAARKALEVLSRPVSAPNYEAARREILHVIELVKRNMNTSTADTPAKAA